MDLILWRHADARIGTPDLKRELTERGQRQAEKMATWLAKHLPHNTRVLVSPATRTQQTAAILSRKVETIDALAPGASFASLLSCAEWPHAKRPVLIVGHQPTLGLAASMLLFGSPEDLTIKKGALIWLSNRVRDGKSQVVLRASLSTEFV
jgi:phosphohistidine phosphatase